MILHSPTERGEVIRRLTALGAQESIGVRSSGGCEPLGVDFAWLDHNDDWRGVQRKELKDFLASLNDGRLAKEISQMNAHVVMPTLLLEGRLVNTNGMLTTGKFGPKITFESFHRRLITIADRGVQVWFTNEPRRTAELIVSYYQWSKSAKHGTAQHRPKPAGDWGKVSNRDWQIHLLQGIDGVGASTAGAIIDTLGRCPLRVDATVEELMTVPGIGKKTAERIIASINGEV